MIDLDEEEVLEPSLPIIDPHHHLWLLPEALADTEAAPEDSMWRRWLSELPRRYLFDDFLGDLRAGHNVLATVFVEGRAMYRAHGPEAFRSVGEVEFANGVAAMAASGTFGRTFACQGIVGAPDLTLGSAAEAVLVAHIEAGNGRYRGVRSPACFDAHPTFSQLSGRPHVLLDTRFRQGFALLRKLELSFDVWIWEPQLPELIDLAQCFPDTQIILNHVGGPLGIGDYDLAERFAAWKKEIRALARCSNVAVKLGGLGSTPIQGLKMLTDKSTPSVELASVWRPYIETCIEAFGVDRAMFESDSPVSASIASYKSIWNAFKRLTIGASPEEKHALFFGTAAKIYRLDLASSK